MAPANRAHSLTGLLETDKGEAMVDRRRTPRIKASMPIALNYNDHVSCCKSIDISYDGMFILTDAALPPDAEVVLRFRLPDDSELLNIESRVVWTKQVSNLAPAGMGIEFIRMSYDHRRKITAFVQLRAEKWALAPCGASAAEDPA
jgi:uncharacterized protein (TIGR02266 family)